MAIKYSIYQDPPRRDGTSPARHVQVRGLETIKNEEFACEIADDVYGRAVCAGVLILLAAKLPKLLAAGSAVHIDGVGTFKPKVSGEISERKRSGAVQLQAKALRVSGVDFQPDTEFLDVVNGHAKFEHQPERRMTDVSDKELRTFLARHFSEHDSLRRSDLVAAFNISKDRAYAYLNSLVADGTLIQQGSRSTSCYVRKG